MKLKIFLSLLLFSVVACTKTSVDDFSSTFPNSTSSNYFKRSTSITLEVYYEPGAEPFVGNIASNMGNVPLWNLTQDNISSLFSARTSPPSLFVPKTLMEMNPLPDLNKETWNPSEVIDLFNDHHNLVATQNQAVFYIYFLNGFSSSGETTIAFSINTTPVIAVFKDVITGAGSAERFIEQSTIIHELGHAFGFVNNGVPMVIDHQDVAHGSHTLNEDCVMYFQNEGLGDFIPFYNNYVATGDSVLWGPEVLADAAAFSD